MIVAFWNRLHTANAEEQARWLVGGGCSQGCPRWDLLLLTEVSKGAASTFEHELGEAAAAQSWVARGAEGRRPHGLMAISRTASLTEVKFPTSPEVAPVELDPHLTTHLIETGHGDALRPRVPRPERWISVRAEGADRPVTVAGFQAPYAAGRNLPDTAQNRMTKREAYRQLTTWAIAEQRAGRGVLIGMDGNNWSDWLDPDVIEPARPKRYRSEHRRLLDEAHLFDVEKEFHGPNPPHDLVDTLRVAWRNGTIEDWHGSAKAAEQFGGCLGMTHRLKRGGPRMDRIYASTDLPVRRAGICHGRLSAAEVAHLQKGTSLCVRSDHALVWADVEL